MLFSQGLHTKGSKLYLFSGKSAAFALKLNSLVLDDQALIAWFISTRDPLMSSEGQKLVWE